MSVLAPPAVATAAVFGSTGLAGRELMRLLASHPRMRAVACAAGTRAPARCDLVLLALPHGVSGEVGRDLAGARVPVIDLSADLRGEWQYGLPELHREAIAGARQVANPGCYATAAILALAPIVAAGLVEPDLVVDGKSGVSGAGKTPTERNSFLRGGRGHRPLPAGRPPPPARDRGPALRGRRRPGLGHVHAAPRAVHARPAGDRLRAAATGRRPGRGGGGAARRLPGRAVRAAGGRRAHAGPTRQQPLSAAGLGRPAAEPRDRGRRHRQPGQGRGRPGRPERQPDAGPGRDAWACPGSRRGCRRLLPGRFRGRRRRLRYEAQRQVGPDPAGLRSPRHRRGRVHHQPCGGGACHGQPSPDPGRPGAGDRDQLRLGQRLHRHRRPRQRLDDGGTRRVPRWASLARRCWSRPRA